MQEKPPWDARLIEAIQRSARGPSAMPVRRTEVAFAVVVFVAVGILSVVLGRFLWYGYVGACFYAASLRARRRGTSGGTKQG
jgi:hypothetical protein